MPVEDDYLDGCDLDFAEAADSEEVSELRPLFPQGEVDASLAEVWHALFGDD